jgi:hypothetical protein
MLEPASLTGSLLFSCHKLLNIPLFCLLNCSASIPLHWRNQAPAALAFGAHEPVVFMMT